MYNRSYKYSSGNNLVFQKQFGFRKGHSTGHPLVELISNVYDPFESE